MTNPRQSERQSGSSSSLTRNYDATVLSDLIARRVAAGYTEADSRQLLADFLDRYEGGNGGVDTERTYVAMDALLSDEAIEAAGRTLDRAYERFEMTLQQVARDAVQAAVDAATGTGGAT